MNNKLSAYLSRLLFCLALPLAAQVDRANLNGTVTDASGAAIPMATVRALSVDTGLQRETHSTTAGTYEIPSLPVGTYEVAFLKDGFKPLTVKSIVLINGQSGTVDGRLEVGETKDAVRVTAAVEVVDKSDAEVGGVVESAAIRRDSDERSQLGDSDAARARRGELWRRLAAQHPFQ